MKPLSQCARVVAVLSESEDEHVSVLEVMAVTGASRRTVFRALALTGKHGKPPADRFERRTWRTSVALVMNETVRISRHGYRRLYLPMHPAASVRGEVAEHRVIAERKLGRFLRRDELVHHTNEKRDDNRPENLSVISHRLHQRLHANRRMRAAAMAASSALDGRRNPTAVGFRRPSSASLKVAA